MEPSLLKMLASTRIGIEALLHCMLWEVRVSHTFLYFGNVSNIGICNRMAFCMRMRCWCGGNVQGVCPSFILALPISVFYAIFDMEAPENTQEFFSIAFL